MRQYTAKGSITIVDLSDINIIGRVSGMYSDTTTFNEKNKDRTKELGLTILIPYSDFYNTESFKAYTFKESEEDWIGQIISYGDTYVCEENGWKCIIDDNNVKSYEVIESEGHIYRAGLEGWIDMGVLPRMYSIQFTEISAKVDNQGVCHGTAKWQLLKDTGSGPLVVKNLVVSQGSHVESMKIKLSSAQNWTEVTPDTETGIFTSPVVWNNVKYSDLGSPSTVMVEFTINGEIRATAFFPFIQDGENGKDSKSREWIYKLADSITTQPKDITTGHIGNKLNPDNITEKNQEDWVPTGWTDNPTGVSSNNRIEWTSCRDYDLTNKRWGDFSDAAKWSIWGSDGKDGDGVEYVFVRTSEEVAPEIITCSDNSYKEDDYLPYAKIPYVENGPQILGYNSAKEQDINPDRVGNYYQVKCSDNPANVSSEYPYQWVAIRKMTSLNGNETSRTWNDYSGKMVLWNTYSKSGTGNVAIFKWGDSTSPGKPNSNDYPPDGWSETAPNRTNENVGKYLWMCTGLLVEGSRNTVESWSDPVRISGEDGTPGEDAKEREWIYCWNYENSTNTPNPNSHEGTYPGGIITNTTATNGVYECQKHDDFIPTDWSDNPQGVTSDNKTEWATWRDYNKSTKLWGEFNTPIIWSHYGERGLDGDGFEYIYTVTNALIFPDDKLPTPNDWRNNESYQGSREYVPTDLGWSDDPIGVDENNRYEWVSTRKRYADNDSPETGKPYWHEFSTPAIWARYVPKGVDGGRYINLYQNSSTAPDMPLNKKASINLMVSNYNWTNDINENLSEGKYTWMVEAFLESTQNNNTELDWTGPIRLTGAKGETGADGTDIEFIYKKFSSILNWDSTTNNTNPLKWPKNDSTVNSATGKKFLDDDYTGPKDCEWNDNPEGVEENKPYEYMSQRLKKDGSWSAFTEPVLWSKWGQDGRDGDGVEYVYCLSKNVELIPDYDIPSDEETNAEKSREYYPLLTVPSGASYFDDLTGTVDSNSDKRWADNPLKIDEDNSVEWVLIRKYNGENKTWTFGSPQIWAKRGDSASNTWMDIEPSLVKTDTFGNVLETSNKFEVKFFLKDGKDNAVLLTNLEILNNVYLTVEANIVLFNDIFDENSDYDNRRAFESKKAITEVDVDLSDTANSSFNVIGLNNNTLQFFDLVSGNEPTPLDIGFSEGDILKYFKIRWYEKLENGQKGALLAKSEIVPNIQGTDGEDGWNIEYIYQRNDRQPATPSINIGSTFVYGNESFTISGILFKDYTSLDYQSAEEFALDNNISIEDIGVLADYDSNDSNYTGFGDLEIDSLDGNGSTSPSENSAYLEIIKENNEVKYSGQIIILRRERKQFIKVNKVIDLCPYGWYDNPQGVDMYNKVEYQSSRKYNSITKTWGNFTTPNIRSNWGNRGIDGDGVEYVYVRTKEEVAPVYYGSKKTIDGENADSHDRLWNEDEYTPMVKVTGTDISGYGDPSPIVGESGVYKVECTDDPQGVTEEWPYEWVLTRRKDDPDENGSRRWVNYSGLMALWAKRGDPSVFHWLEISPTSVNVDHEYKLTEAVSDITVNLWKQVGDNNPVRLTKAEIEPIGGLFVRGIINSSIDPSTDFSIDDYEEFLSYFVLDDNGTFHSANMTDLDENGNPIYTRKGLSIGTEFRSLSFSWDNYDTKEIHVNVAGAPGPQGPQGPQGPEGQQGKVGKAYYMAGDYTNREYISDEYQTPVVHIINSEGKDEWHVLVADSNNVGTGFRPVYRSPLGDSTVYLGKTIWRKAFTEYDVVMTKAIFADFASLGSALVYGDYLFSKHGTIGTTAYDDDNPNYVLDRPAYLRFCGGSENYNRRFENRYISVTPNSEYRTVDLVTFEATKGEILGGYINCTKVSGSAIIGIAVRKDDGTVLWDGDISFAANGSGDIYEMIYDAEGEEVPEFTSDGVYTLYATVSNNTTASYNISGNITLTGGAFIPNWMVDLRTGNMIAAKGKFKVEGDKVTVEGKITAKEGSIGGFDIGEDYIISTNGMIELNNDGEVHIGNLHIDGGGNITAEGGTFNNITALGGTFNEVNVSGTVRAKILYNSITTIDLSGSQSTTSSSQLLSLCGGTLSNILVIPGSAISYTVREDSMRILELPSASDYNGFVLYIYADLQPKYTTYIGELPVIKYKSDKSITCLSTVSTNSTNHNSHLYIRYMFLSNGQEWSIIERSNSYVDGNEQLSALLYRNL